MKRWILLAGLAAMPSAAHADDNDIPAQFLGEWCRHYTIADKYQRCTKGKDVALRFKRTSFEVSLDGMNAWNSGKCTHAVVTPEGDYFRIRAECELGWKLFGPSAAQHVIGFDARGRLFLDYDEDRSK